MESDTMNIPTTPCFYEEDLPEDGSLPVLDPDRARRALELDVHYIGQDRYFVDNGKGGYWVNLDPLDCNCGDAVWNNQICRHLIAALTLAGYGPAVETVARAYEKLESEREEEEESPEAETSSSSEQLPEGTDDGDSEGESSNQKEAEEDPFAPFRKDPPGPRWEV